MALVLLGLLLAQLAGAGWLMAQTPPPGPPRATPSPAGKAEPPPALPAEITAALSKATSVLAEVEKSLEHLSAVEGGLADLRAKVEEVLDSTSSAADALRPQLEAVKSQIEKLGQAPGKDAPAEPPEMAAERARLAALAAVYDGAIKTSDLNWLRARQLIERITVLRHSLFTKNLMERTASPLTPGAWRQAASEASSVYYQLTAWAVHWWELARPRQTELGLLAAGAAALLVLLRIALWPATHRRSRRAQPPLPTFVERAASAVWVAALRTLPVALAGLVLYIGLDALNLLPSGNPWARLFPAVVRSVVIFAGISALARAVLAPSAPQWRLVPLADAPARRLTLLLVAIAAVYTLDAVLTEACRRFYVPLTLSVAQSIISSLAFAALLAGVLLTPFTPQPAPAETGAETGPEPGAEAAPAPPPPVSRQAPRWLKLPLWLLTIGIVAAALLGYVALARFVSQQILLTGIVVLLYWLGYLAIRAFTREPTQQSRAVGGLLERQFGLDRPRREQLARLTEAALTLALAICALPFLMLQWGFSAADIRDWSKALLFGFEIGQFRFSLVRILAAIVLFIALLFATRIIQRWLRDRLLQSRMDPSIANSIETVAGYAGIALAALIALSYGGLDITNLAIVAGALSLGIGFGLQSIVNNFVSGLILLIERPIKVGDRVVVGGREGHVRRISVRATEVETFDRASVIVPNSELITGQVVNWSHRDWRGAASVKVGVAYSADPDAVVAILKACAAEHPLVLPDPPPSVALEAFGDSALLFSLRISLADVDKAAGVQSDLRIAILKALRAAGIDIPFNQLDVTLRDLDAVRRQLDAALERPANGANVGHGAPDDGAQAAPLTAGKES